MDTVLRGLAIYVFLLLVFRVAGKRTLAQVTTFDFVLLIIIAEATQQGLLGEDFSVTNALLLIVTLVTADILLALWKQRSKRVDRIMEGTPLVIVEEGRPLEDRMAMVQLDESDILAAARQLRGLERMDQIKYAVLERSGGISIIPRRDIAS